MKTPKTTKPKKTLLLVMLFLLVVIICTLGFLVFPQEFLLNFSLTFLGIIPTVISYIIFSNLGKSDNTVVESSDYYDAIRKTLDIKSQPQSADIMELMLANMKEIKDYYALSKTQAKNSFFLSVTMCVCGFLLIALSVAVPLLSNVQNYYSFIPAIGGVIIEVIAGTSLFVYRKSLSQLNHYYSELHENERFLSSVNLINKMSKDRQDDMYEKVILAQLELTKLHKKQSASKNEDCAKPQIPSAHT